MWLHDNDIWRWERKSEYGCKLLKKIIIKIYKIKYTDKYTDKWKKEKYQITYREFDSLFLDPGIFEYRTDFLA